MARAADDDTTGLSILPETLEWVPVDSLSFFPGNANEGDVPGIVESIKANRFFRPLLVQRSTMHVVYGNSTLKAVRELGWKRVQVALADIDDDEAARINVADNAYRDRSSWNVPLLVKQLDKFKNLEGTGFAPLDVEGLRATLKPPAPPPGGSAGAGMSGMVVVQVGTVSFAVDGDEFHAWHDGLVLLVGKEPAAQVVELRERLGFS